MKNKLVKTLMDAALPLAVGTILAAVGVYGAYRAMETPSDMGRSGYVTGVSGVGERPMYDEVTSEERRLASEEYMVEEGLN